MEGRAEKTKKTEIPAYVGMTAGVGGFCCLVVFCAMLDGE